MDDAAGYADVSSRLQEIVDEAARAIGRPVALDDRHHHLLVYSEHPSDEVDPVRLASILRQPATPRLLEWLSRHGVRTSPGPVRVPAVEEIGLGARVCIPIRRDTHLLGFFWLIDRDESLDLGEIRRAQQAADEAGVVLYREIRMRDREHRRERELVRDVLSPDQHTRAKAAGVLGEHDLFVATAPIVAVVVSILDEREELSEQTGRLSLEASLMRARRWLNPRHGVSALRSSHAVMLVSLADPGIRDQGRMAFAQRLHDQLRHTVAEHDGLRCIVAVGGRANSLLDAAESERQALRAAKVAAAVPSVGDVVNWEELGVYRVLTEMPLDRLTPASFHPPLGEVLAEARNEPLLQTVECYLDHAGDAQATIAELFLHRTSLYQRLRRFERVAEIDLSSGADRLVLHLGLKLARLQGYAWGISEPDPRPSGP